MKRIITLLVLLSIPPATGYAADPLLDQPHWSLELKGGAFQPALDDWKEHYGSDKTPHYAGTIAYKLLRQLEVGIEGGYMHKTGKGDGQSSGNLGGKVKYELFPIQPFILLRGVFSENQWLVPYVGGGLTKLYYQEKIQYQDTVRGSVNGYHGRAGLQLLLDGMDPDAANNLYLDYGVFHTYLFVEAEYIRVMTGTPSIDLGGKSYLAGFLFEF